jgi:uncharacterized protein (DUF885 family)
LPSIRHSPPTTSRTRSIGQLEILRLRADAKARLDGRFDIKSFHDVVLGSGAVSLPVLGALVEYWLSRSPAAKH